MFGAQSLKSVVLLVQSSASLRSLSPKLFIEIETAHGQLMMLLHGVEANAGDSHLLNIHNPLINMHRHSGGERLLPGVRQTERPPVHRKWNVYLDERNQLVRVHSEERRSADGIHGQNDARSPCMSQEKDEALERPTP